MPSARYTLNIKPEDIRPDAPRELTPKEKRANWWHYHWKWVLLALVCLCMVGLTLKDIFGQPKPDYRVAVITRYNVPEEAADQLSEALSVYGQDLNGDGRTLVQVDAYTVNFTGYVEPAESQAPGGEAASGSGSSEPADVGTAMNDVAANYEQVANLTRLTADLQDDQTLIFLMDDPAGFQEVGGVLASSAGALPAERTALAGVDLFLWRDCPALAGLELGEYTDMLGQNPAPSETLFQGLYLARRGFDEGRSQKKYGPENEAFFNALIQGAKAQ